MKQPDDAIHIGFLYQAPLTNIHNQWLNEIISTKIKILSEKRVKNCSSVTFLFTQISRISWRCSSASSDWHQLFYRPLFTSQTNYQFKQMPTIHCAPYQNPCHDYVCICTCSMIESFQHLFICVIVYSLKQQWMVAMKFAQKPSLKQKNLPLWPQYLDVPES